MTKKLGGLGLTALLLAGLASAAQADWCLRSRIPGQKPVEYKMPSGETVKTTLYPDEKLGQANSSSLPDGVKSTPVVVKDDMDGPLWSGSLRNNTCNLLFTSSDGKAHVEQVGWWVDAGQAHPSAVIIVNLTGQSFKLDFFGQGGAQGLQGAPVAAGLDFKTPIRLPQEESVYNVLFRSSDGQELNRNASAISRGRFLALVKKPDGTFELENLGWIKSPGKNWE